MQSAGRSPQRKRFLRAWMEQTTSSTLLHGRSFHLLAHRSRYTNSKLHKNYWCKNPTRLQTHRSKASMNCAAKTWSHIPSDVSPCTQDSNGAWKMRPPRIPAVQSGPARLACGSGPPPPPPLPSPPSPAFFFTCCGRNTRLALGNLYLASHSWQSLGVIGSRRPDTQSNSCKDFLDWQSLMPSGRT